MSDYMYIPPSRKLLPKKPKQFGIHIFYGEGIKTEPQYVENMKVVLQTRYKMTVSDMIIIDSESGGRNTLGLVKYAEKDVASRIKNGKQVDHVWIFYDKDSFKKDKYDNTYFKITSKNKKDSLNDDNEPSDSNKTRWHALWSNECFELWVLLHFQYSNTALPRSNYIPSIDIILDQKEKGLTYEKNLINLYQLLEKYGNIKNAVCWAKKLDNRLSNKNVKDNPSTGIYELMEYFNLYLKLGLKT